MKLNRAALLSVVFCSFVGPAAAEVRYTLTPLPQESRIAVAIELESKEPELIFRIPAWSPGFYFLQSYQKKIESFSATDGSGIPLTFTHDDPRAWKVSNSGLSKVRISYRVIGDDPGLGFFAVSVKPNTVFVNGPAAFMYAEGRKDEPMKLTISNPGGWDVATSMSGDAERGFTAASYDELLDHPLRLGKFERRKFTVEGLPFEVVFASTNQKYAPDLDKIAKELQTLSAPALRMFGGAAFKKYVYLVNLAIGDFSGGLEHRSSNVIAVWNSPDLSLGSLATHEFFHAWNVKQIRPSVLGPFDYTKEVRTGNLWFSEGVTDYYANITAYRSGLYGSDWLLRSLGSGIAGLQQGTTRLTKTVEDASREAWENGGFSVGDLSFYTKGSIIGLLLDAQIRGASEGRKSLDDAMRLMYQRYRLPQPGFDEDGIKRTVSEVAKKDLGAVYDRMVRSTAEMPYEKLKLIGLRLLEPGKETRALGFTIEEDLVTRVEPQGEPGGVAIGDRILSVDGRPWAEALLSKIPDRYVLRISRRGKDRQLKLKVLRITPKRYGLEPDPFRGPAQAALLADWLKR